LFGSTTAGTGRSQILPLPDHFCLRSSARGRSHLCPGTGHVGSHRRVSSSWKVIIK
jgi:hypothetical protein